MTDYSYLGSGKIWIRVAGAAAPLLEVGNCSALTFSVTEDVKELKDFTQPGGGTYNEVRRISAVEMSLTAHDLSPANLSKALYGVATHVASGTATLEVVTGGARLGGLNLLAHIPLAITIVKDSAAAITYTAGSDYELRPGGIYIPSTSTIVEADLIKVTYTYDTHDVVQALIESGKEYEILFAGLNEARSGKQVTVQVHRGKIGAAQQIALIGEDYAGLQMSGKLLKDTTKNGTTISQYFVSKLVA